MGTVDKKKLRMFHKVFRTSITMQPAVGEVHLDNFHAEDAEEYNMK